jgi:hypothetical protein
LDIICWENIIEYTDIPLPAPGIFWIPSNKIYIQSSVKRHQLYHEYLIEHEKKHYINYNSKRNFCIKVIKEIWMEWCDTLTMYFFIKELKNAKNNYLKIWQKETQNKRDVFYSTIWQKETPNRNQRFYANIVKFFSPDSKILAFIIIILAVLYVLFIMQR